MIISARAFISGLVEISFWKLAFLSSDRLVMWMAVSMLTVLPGHGL